MTARGLRPSGRLAPAATVLGARDNAGQFNHAEADMLGVMGATKVLSAADQQNLIDWAGAKWGV